MVDLPKPMHSMVSNAFCKYIVSYLLTSPYQFHLEYYRLEESDKYQLSAVDENQIGIYKEFYVCPN